MDDRENGIGKPIDRRSFLQLMAAAGGGAAMSGLGIPAAGAADPTFELANKKYLKLYDEISGYYFKDPQWVKDTASRLTWPQTGEKVPELVVVLPSIEQHWIDAYRKWTADAAQIGLKYNVSQASQARWLELINSHRHGDIEMHPSILRPERVDPSEWLVSRAYGLDRRNYGEWVNEQYDKLIEEQASESDPAKRLKLVKSAQKVLAEDLYIQQVGWGPAIIEAFNSADWDGIVRSKGFGIANFNAFLCFTNMKPKGSRKSVKVGMTSLLETTNIIAAANNMRSIGRMIYDRLAYFDENLNVIPWAAESWKRLDDRTWDITLRKGMKFHDGKPVTIQDLKFTFDFMVKWERGIYWTANRFLEGTDVVDEARGVLRVKFKEPYSQFESYFMQLNVILPRHIWQNVMADQGIADDPRKLRIDKPIGSGPFSFGRYRKDTELQLVANKAHFSKPKVEDVWVVVMPSLDGLLGRLESKEIDMIESSNTSLSPSQAAQLGKSKHVTIVRTPDVNWLHGVCRISWLPWRDYEFRRAWNHSIDRDFLVNVVWEGAGRTPVSNTFLTEGSPWYNADLPPIPKFDLKVSREILAAAGYSWASDGRLVFPPPTDAKFRDRVVKVCKADYTWGGLKMRA